MNAYVATFADGSQLNRGTKRSYSHAWRATVIDGGRNYVCTGFAKTEDLAFVAARRAVVNYAPNGYMYWQMSSAEKYACRQARAEFIASNACVIEVVPAVAA